jgi:hypothetical protein
MSTPWEGTSRAPLRVGLAAIAAIDLVVVAANVALANPGTTENPLAPAWLRLVSHRPVAPLGIALLGLAALAQFARQRRPLLHGSVAILALAILTEAHAALMGGPMRNFFTSGAMLLGWLFGLGCAKRLDDGHERSPRERAAFAEQLAERGAVGALAATYVGAAISKLSISGAAWVESASLRAVVLSQHRVDDASFFGSYARAVGASPGLATLLSFAALVAQLSAVAMPFSRRLRMATGTLVLLFHLNAWALLHILYGEAIALTALFSYPWARLLARFFSGDPSPDIDASLSRTQVMRGLSPFVAIFLAALLVAYVSPLRAYTALHHREGVGQPSDAIPGAYPSDVRALLGGLEKGDDLAGWRVEAVGLAPSGVAVVLVARRDERFALSIAKKGNVGHPAPSSTKLYDLYYSRPSDAVPHDQIDAALTALQDRISSRETAVPVPAGMGRGGASSANGGADAG